MALHDRCEIPECMTKDLLAKHLGIEILEAGPGYAKTRLVVDNRHLNGYGMTHGAAVFALADMAFATASNSRGKKAVALHMDIYFLRATGKGDELVAVAEEDYLTGRTGLYRIAISTPGGERIALAEGVVHRSEKG